MNSSNFQSFPRLSVQAWALLRLLRPQQILKSSFVFIGLLFARQWSDITLLGQVISAALAFSLVASGVYVLNDMLDCKYDRLHPDKRHRPLAARQVTLSAAGALLLVVWLLGFGLGLWVSVTLFMLLSLYALINVAYSLGLKHVVILDVFLLASGFVLRILAGTLGVGIPPSQWLLLTGTCVALFLGFAKRRAEILRLQQRSALHRRVLEDYNNTMLDKALVICASTIIMAYSLYTMSPETLYIHGSSDLIYTVPFVLYGVFRYLHLLHQGVRGGDPSSDVVADPHLLGTVILWLLTTVWIIL